MFKINTNRKTRRQNIKKTTMTAMAILMTTAMLAGCGSASKTGSTSNSSSSAETTSTESTTTTASTTSLNGEEMFTERDLDSSYDESEAETITLSDDKSSSSSYSVKIDGQTITITEEGIYVISGSLSDGQIVVDCEDEEAKVQIVLDGAEITNDSTACIYTLNADKVFVTSKEGTTNKLSVTGSYEAIDDNNIDGVIFAKTDLVLNGTGTLEITGAEGHGVVCKDDLKVAEDGTYKITAESGHGLQGKDSVRIAGGNMTITAGKDAIHSGNDEDANEGFVYIAGGELTIDAGDDGIHADNETYIADGTITINKSNEGIEGSVVTVESGTIDVTSSDDGFNAAGGSDSSDTQNQDMFANDESAGLYINGGTITVNAEGDGLDSNGLLEMNGGTVYVSGPTNDGNGALDFGGEAVINGGTIIAAGSSGMAETFGENSTQANMIVNLSSSQTGKIELKDSDGNVIASYTPEKQYSSVVVSCADMTEDGTYTLSAGSETQEITMDGICYGEGSKMGGPMGGDTREGGHGMAPGQGGFGGSQEGSDGEMRMGPGQGEKTQQ